MMRRGGGTRRHSHYSTYTLQEGDNNNEKMTVMKNCREDYPGVISHKPYKKKMMTMRRRQNELITNNIQHMMTPKSKSL